MSLQDWTSCNGQPNQKSGNSQTESFTVDDCGSRMASDMEDVYKLHEHFDANLRHMT